MKIFLYFYYTGHQVIIMSSFIYFTLILTVLLAISIIAGYNNCRVKSTN